MTKTSDVDNLELEPENNEIIGVVSNMLGGSRLRVVCMDDEERMCRIPGRLKNKVWIEEDDVVIVEPWDWQDEKGDVVHKYKENEVDVLKENDYLE